MKPRIQYVLQPAELKDVEARFRKARMRDPTHQELDAEAGRVQREISYLGDYESYRRGSSVESSALAEWLLDAAVAASEEDPLIEMPDSIIASLLGQDHKGPFDWKELSPEQQFNAYQMATYATQCRRMVRALPKDQANVPFDEAVARHQRECARLRNQRAEDIRQVRKAYEDSCRKLDQDRTEEYEQAKASYADRKARRLKEHADTCRQIKLAWDRASDDDGEGSILDTIEPPVYPPVPDIGPEPVLGPVPVYPPEPATPPAIVFPPIPIKGFPDTATLSQLEEMVGNPELNLRMTQWGRFMLCATPYVVWRFRQDVLDGIANQTTHLADQWIAGDTKESFDDIMKEARRGVARKLKARLENGDFDPKMAGQDLDMATQQYISY